MTLDPAKITEALRAFGGRGEITVDGERIHVRVPVTAHLLTDAADLIDSLLTVANAADEWLTNCYEADGVSYQVGHDTEWRLHAAVRARREALS